MSHITNSLGQVFKPQSATILSAIRVNTPNGSFISVTLNNGDVINASLAAISRAVNYKLDWSHIPKLRGAVVDYYSSEYVAGKQFSWRPNDKKFMTATNSGLFQTLLGISPADRYIDMFDELPAYVSESAELVEVQDEQHEESETPETPHIEDAVVIEPEIPVIPAVKQDKKDKKK
jgi:hypothetical protein